MVAQYKHRGASVEAVGVKNKKNDCTFNVISGIEINPIMKLVHKKMFQQDKTNPIGVADEDISPERKKMESKYGPSEF